MNYEPDLKVLQSKGFYLDSSQRFATDAALAMDNTNSLMGTTPNSAIPSYLTQWMDPRIIEWSFSPLRAAEILGEAQKGDWLTETATFPVIEWEGEVSTYGDYNMNGGTDLNMNFPNRQVYYYQTFIEYGEREEARAGLARVAWAAGLQKAAINTLNRFQNNTYFRGVANLENYGLLNDPDLTPAIQPGVKDTVAGASGTTWFKPDGTPNASNIEVYNDWLSLFNVLVAQSSGIIDIDNQTSMTLGLGPESMTALGFINNYNQTVRDLMKNAFPNLRIVSATQYGVVSATNPTGNVAGNFMQVIADGMEAGFCAFNEKLRTHKMVILDSSSRQKFSQGSFGAVLTKPYLIAQMVGI